jgi:hypothetical protein
VNIKEEKVKRELRGKHSDYHWVEVRKREQKMEQSTEKQAAE